MMNSEEKTLSVTLAIVIAMIGAWFTHVIHCLVYAKYLLLIAGGFIFPVGIIHGIGIWFGASW